MGALVVRAWLIFAGAVWANTDANDVVTVKSVRRRLYIHREMLSGGCVSQRKSPTPNWCEADFTPTTLSLEAGARGLRDNTQMHAYSVALRISGVKLDTEEITSTLKLTPTQIRIAGQKRSAKSLWTESLWEYEVRPGDGKVCWTSLEEGLATLLSALAPHKSALQQYQQACAVFLWCGHFSSSFNGGPTFSPSLLRQLGDLGIELRLDTYFSEETGGSSK